jgi:hypothetical protein
MILSTLSISGDLLVENQLSLLNVQSTSEVKINGMMVFRNTFDMKTPIIFIDLSTV